MIFFFKMEENSHCSFVSSQLVTEPDDQLPQNFSQHVESSSCEPDRSVKNGDQLYTTSNDRRQEFYSKIESESYVKLYMLNVKPLFDINSWNLLWSHDDTKSITTSFSNQPEAPSNFNQSHHLFPRSDKSLQTPFLYNLDTGANFGCFYHLPRNQIIIDQSKFDVTK